LTHKRRRAWLGLLPEPLNLLKLRKQRLELLLEMRSSLNTSIGKPTGFAGVFSINGGIALISTAAATRFVP